MTLAAAPTNVHVSQASTRSVTLAWQGSAARYALWRDDVMITRVGDVRSYTFTGLEPDTAYRVGVRSVRRFARSSVVYVAVRTAPLATPPPASSSLSIGAYQ